MVAAAKELSKTNLISACQKNVKQNTRDTARSPNLKRTLLTIWRQDKISRVRYELAHWAATLIRHNFVLVVYCNWSYWLMSFSEQKKSKRKGKKKSEVSISGITATNNQEVGRVYIAPPHQVRNTKTNWRQNTSIAQSREGNFLWVKEKVSWAAVTGL